MGKSIDRMLGLTLGFTALYALFMAAFSSIPISCVLTLLCAVLLRRPKSSRARRISAHEAEMLAAKWACQSDDICISRIAALMERSEDDPNLLILPRHPMFSLSAGDVFSAWKAHRGSDRLTIAASCRADERARTLARTLTSPAVELADLPVLIQRMRRAGLTPPEPAPLRERLSRLCAKLASLPARRRWNRYALSGAGLMAMYMATSNAPYLLLSVAVLFLSGISLRKQRFT